MKPVYAIRGEFPGGEIKFWNDQHRTWVDEVENAETSSYAILEATIRANDCDPTVWGPWVCEIAVAEVEI